MCDYSLMTIPNRLARQGEELVTHRFPTGSLGLASPGDIARAQNPPRRNTGRLGWLKAVVNGPPRWEPVPAVCIPPGARLGISDVPKRIQGQYRVDENEKVVFVQLTAETYHFRDAVEFTNGARVLLQDFPAGVLVRVLDLSGATEREPVWEETHTGYEPADVVRR